MTNPTTTSMRDALQQKLIPLVFLLAIIVSLSAPSAYYFLRLRSLQQQAKSFANQVVSFVQKEAHQHPVMWRYDMIKMLSHLRSYHAPKQLLCIKIMDSHRRKVIQSCASSTQPTQGKPVWGTSVIVQGQQTLGRVWVAMSTHSTRRNTLLLLLLFSGLSGLLGWLLYYIPYRTVDRAENEIHSLIDKLEKAQGKLSSLNRNLETQVDERTLALHEANQQLQQKESRLRELSTQAMTVQEEERRAIARDLHDSIGQSLTAVRLQLQLLHEGQLPSDKTRAVASQALSMTDQTIEEVRRTVHRLGPSVLHDFGLLVSLQRLCDTFSAHSPIVITTHLDEDIKGLSSSVENALYRITQEAFNNITKHAEAKHVVLVLKYTEAQILLSIEDDGCGFLVKPFLDYNWRGLMGIGERCELLGGTFQIESIVGQGTTLSVLFPVNRTP